MQNANAKMQKCKNAKSEQPEVGRQQVSGVDFRPKVKAASERVQTKVYFQYAEREQAR